MKIVGILNTCMKSIPETWLKTTGETAKKSFKNDWGLGLQESEQGKRLKWCGLTTLEKNSSRLKL